GFKRKIPSFTELDAMIKKILFAGGFFLYALAGAAQPDKGLTIVTSFYPVYITTLNVAGHITGVRVTNLTRPVTGCLHDYSLTADDMKKLATADILVINGYGMESFFTDVAKRYPRLKTIDLSDGIPVITGPGGDNPHVWVSITNAIIQVHTLGKALAALDPVHKDIYSKNASEYAERLEALKTTMHRELGAFRGKKIVTFHEAFPYFAREFGLETSAVIEREPGSQPSARELATTIDIIKANGIKAIFAEPQYPAMAAQTIAKETGSRVYTLDPAVTGPDTPEAYLVIMEKNLATLKKALR
ncbi:MAG: metal ABC transporter substrate-binding protein, partial [Candidatus Omnitrophica bacterium]|nr:metal ABC transporter substrate-binding protein [Candidatus Omnitrophota bacterium]